MAKCDVCGKGVHFGNNVSHSHRRSNRMFFANVKKVKVKVNGTPKTMHVCTLKIKKQFRYETAFFMLKISLIHHSIKRIPKSRIYCFII